MARSVSFQYKYPYNVWADASRFYMDYDTSRTTLSGNYTYALSFQKNYPYIVKARINIYAENVKGTSVLNRSWYLYLYNGSWRTLVTFTMPSNGEYIWEGNIGYSSCQKFAAVPTTTMSTSTEWTLGISIDEMTIQETITTTDFATRAYFTLFPNYGGVTQRPTQISANIDGTLIAAKNILVNVDGSLVELPTVYSGTYTTTTPDSFRLYEFTPPSTGTYRIQVLLNSGDHEARLYNSSFTKLDGDGYFYDGSFSLTGGSLYYIMLTHYYYNTNTADSIIFITKS